MKLKRRNYNWIGLSIAMMASIMGGCVAHPMKELSFQRFEEITGKSVSYVILVNSLEVTTSAEASQLLTIPITGKVDGKSYVAQIDPKEIGVTGPSACPVGLELRHESKKLLYSVPDRSNATLDDGDLQRCVAFGMLKLLDQHIRTFKNRN